MQNTWKSDGDLFRLVRTELTTAVIGDALDAHGCRHQFLPPALRALRDEDMIVGRAMTVLEADVFDDSDPFGRMFEALDDLRPGDVYLAAGGCGTYAFFGELMATAARARGANGAVLCGYHRDTRGLRQQDLPVFSYGAYAQDQGPRGRVLGHRVPLEVKGVRIESGDLVVGDLDGVLIIPRQIEEAVVHAALEKSRTESKVREALRSGMLARDAFDVFGVM